MAAHKLPKRGQTILLKGKQYTVVYPSLNHVFIKDEHGKMYKVSYHNFTIIDETTHN